MKRSVLFWFLAVIITLLSAYYQRVTGPSYPFSNKINIDNQEIAFHLDRSHSSSGDCEIKIETNNPSLSGILEWKRFKTDDDFTKVELKNEKGLLSASLPKQPAAGKLQYRITLNNNNAVYEIPAEEKYVIIRYKDDVPLFILIPHIIAMFGTMLLSTRTGFEILNKEPRLKIYIYWTIGFLITGGMILGPITQLYAFGALWTGIPFGIDLTDNKTLIALIGWLVAAFMLKRSPKPERWVLGASVLLFLIYLIPHSVLGSELDYNKADKNKSQTEIINQN